mgnify:CR=1 FL=1|tara:strand:- start:540 stop:860 length:321 start_codon:yes stop_codon:yes gene_type:complete
MNGAIGSFHETLAGTDSGAAATHAAKSDKYFVVTHISGHTDTDSLLRILDGTDVVWESAIDISLEGIQIKSPPGLNIVCSKGNKADFVIVSSTSDCQANIGGYEIP